MSPPQDYERRFVERLQTLVEREDRAALAALRRGLGKRLGEAAELYPYVIPWLAPGASDWEEERFNLVASLFAWHQRSWAPGDGIWGESRYTNLGASFARLRHVADSNSTEQRFVALLNCRREDLREYLRHAVGLLRAHEIPIDWAQLLRDLDGWEWNSRVVQRSWAKAFWAEAREDKDVTPNDGTDDTDGDQAAV